MKKTLLSRDWLVRRPGGSFVPVDLPHDGSTTLPRDPAAPGGADTGYFASTDLTYVKHLRLPADATHAILDLDGAYMLATVFLNADQLCVHPHGYTPWLVDLSAGIHPGATDKLRIDTSGIQPSTRWYSGSGLYRDVFLWTGGPVRIEPRATFVRTESADADRARVLATTVLSSDRPGDFTLRAHVTAPDGREAASADALVHLGPADRSAPASFSFDIDHPDLWDLGHGALYSLRIDVCGGDALLDSDTHRFGIRTLVFDAEHGLRINGRSVKLRGGCIHHDNGVLGAAAVPAAERRRARLLQKTGFNAIRIAHNPPSRAMLEACDELGIALFDEAFDMWNRAKRANDHHLWFADWWQRDIDAMTIRDRNHPCVFAYSIGNEICERNGNSDGAAWARRLADEFRRIDPTRPVTSAFCNLWDIPLPGDEDPDDCKDTGFPYHRLDWNERNDTHFASMTQPAADALDIVGYNYMPERYASDHALFPHRVLWGSETFPRTFYDSWTATLANPHVFGDFVWTSFDYLGEAGIGRGAWHDPNTYLDIPQSYPWRAAYDADLDLCGFRRPQSYLREAVWLGNAEPRIWTRHPRHNGLSWAGSPWSFPDVIDTWNFEPEWIGKPVRCEVYTDADEIAFFLNGRPVGTARPEKAIAALDIPYEPGRLTARAVRAGKTIAESSLETVGAPAKVSLVPECPTFAADRRDLAYVRIAILDAEGRRVPDCAAALSCSVEGGELAGIFSADPCNEDDYAAPACHAFHGRALVILRTAQPGTVTLTVSSPGLPDATCSVRAE